MKICNFALKKCDIPQDFSGLFFLQRLNELHDRLPSAFSLVKLYLISHIHNIAYMLYFFKQFSQIKVIFHKTDTRLHRKFPHSKNTPSAFHSQLSTFHFPLSSFIFPLNLPLATQSKNMLKSYQETRQTQFYGGEERMKTETFETNTSITDPQILIDTFFKEYPEFSEADSEKKNP